MCIGMANGGKTPKELTGKDIIKDLDSADVFLRNRANSKPAPLNEYDIEVLLDIAKICDEAAKIISQQQTEIEELRSTHPKYNFQVYQDIFNETENKIKSEAIKELEVKIHEKLHQAEMHGNFEPVVTREMFDSVVEEMVGEQG